MPAFVARAIVIMIMIVMIANPATTVMPALGRGRSLLDGEALPAQRIRLHPVVNPAIAVTRVPVIVHVIDASTLVHDVWIRVGVHRFVLSFDEHGGFCARSRVTTAERE
jgi:hypothetical protein